MENTDEEHPMTVAQMIEELSRYGITAERKSIYDDLEELRSFGADIIYRKAKKHEYYVASRIFELPELKLLADAVASSKFITERKSRQLIKKIESLCSKHEARQLRRQVYVMGRAKTMNEKIYYNVDKIHQAIALDRQISFKYFEYNLKKEKQYRQGGEKYFASPYALSWDDENYYMTAFYEKYGSLSNFRIDKMENVPTTKNSTRRSIQKEFLGCMRAGRRKSAYNSIIP
jgi:predicted DNA-binding transcriptional regulator YafY